VESPDGGYSRRSRSFFEPRPIAAVIEIPARSPGATMELATVEKARRVRAMLQVHLI
jgi:hypothetical protein